MKCLIVTGYSGAGKSLAIHALEDLGFYCVDNLPPSLITQFMSLTAKGFGSERRLAIVCDVRGGEDFGLLFGALADLKQQGTAYKILFLEARPDVLERRYKETRRRHPLAMGGELSTEEAISRERQILTPVYEMADYTIDTSILSTAQLRQTIVSMFAEKKSQSLQLNFMSFGFKHGTPRGADLVLDVRCLPNPFYIPALKNQTGRDEGVIHYVLDSEDTKGLLDRLMDLLDYTLPLYEREGKSELTVAVGCTGGRHRSVVICDALAAHCAAYEPLILHRDIDR